MSDYENHKKQIGRAINPIVINPYDGEDLLLNRNGYAPYIGVEELLIIKKKVENSLSFALDNDIEGLNQKAIVEYTEQANINSSTVRCSKKRKATKIYLMVDRNTGFYKIGRSDSPLKRERTLQSEKPTIELIASWESVAIHEKWLHEKFNNKRIRGEWFDLSQEDVNFILENIQVTL